MTPVNHESWVSHDPNEFLDYSYASTPRDPQISFWYLSVCFMYYRSWRKQLTSYAAKQNRKQQLLGQLKCQLYKWQDSSTVSICHFVSFLSSIPALLMTILVILTPRVLWGLHLRKWQHLFWVKEDLTKVEKKIY